jgi:hypothetical protein
MEAELPGEFPVCRGEILHFQWEVVIGKGSAGDGPEVDVTLDPRCGIVFHSPKL